MSNSLAKMVGYGTPPQAAGAISGDVATGLTATGSTQATALALAANYNLFTTVAASTGCVLPAITPVPGLGVVAGDEMMVFNNGANALLVYPPLGSQIGTAAANAGFSVAAGKSAVFVMLTNTIWGANLSA